MGIDFMFIINYIIYNQVQNYLPKCVIFIISFKTSSIIYFNLVSIITSSKMRKLTVRKSDHTSKNTGKISIILNSKSNTNSSKKHNRNDVIVQFKYSFKSHIPDESEITSEDEESSKFVKDIS